jgi:hypothetical protein
LGDERTKLSIVLGIIAIIVIGIGSGNHSAYAAKLTASSYGDGYSRGVKDASRDLQGLNGHGYDSSCPSGHTSVFCDGYFRGYDVTWNGGSSGGSGSTFSGTPRASLVDKVCNFAQTNPTAAAGAATLLGYPGLDTAVRALCALR